MKFKTGDHSLIVYGGNETVEITAWGKNAFRVRATQYPKFSGNDNALCQTETAKADIHITPEQAEIKNGKLRCVFDCRGWMTFFKDNKLKLRT